MSSDMLDRNFRRRKLPDMYSSDLSAEVSADESSDVLAWKGKQKEGSPNPSGSSARMISGEEFLTPIPMSNIDWHWEAVSRIAIQHDIGMLKKWKDELEKCLVLVRYFSRILFFQAYLTEGLLRFSQVGICSAVSAGFSVQYLCSFTGTQAVISRFLHISQSMAGTTLGPEFTPSVPISILWVSSFVVCLGAVIVGITGLQWIREYLSDPRLGPKEGLAFRQIRFDGLMFWKVSFIIDILPILLILSILAFFHGLLLFLNSLNKTVANAIAIPVAVVWVFLGSSIMLPALQCIFTSEERVRGNQCPYKSPQARIFNWVAFWLSILVIRGLRRLGCKAAILEKKQTFLEKLLEGGLDWVSFDATWQRERLMKPSDKSQEREAQDIAPALAWSSNTGGRSVEGIHAIYSSLRDVHPEQGLEAIRKLAPEEFISELSLQCGHDHRHDEVLKDMMGAVLLGYSVRNNHQLQAPLFQHRLELFIRIANSLVMEFPGEERKDTRAMVEKYFTGGVNIINPFSKDQDYAEVPPGMSLNASFVEK
ncbi:hypothetical protein M413DRAFT_138152 [Hebeloma cylindrosporum]|uniref:DUF6535 domain-containing protein n=1 Tax=Hebeloma cylindrosporum TaxID=76867 RepID=A0A0C3CDV9_HEBCY|nr:hypothetical protein M413DRAFT_138152 [Hebeloma cylindrosporum h7]